MNRTILQKSFIDPPAYLRTDLDARAKDCAIALIVRRNYGGMKGDMHMIIRLCNESD